MMQRSRWWAERLGILLAIALLVPALSTCIAEKPKATAEKTKAKSEKPKATRPRRAEDVSRQFLPRHPRPRDESEMRIVTVMDDMQDNQSRGMGNVYPEDGRLLRMFTEALEAKRVVEVGTANGYSAMWFCLALRATGGKLTTHEIDPQRIALARENFRRAGVEDIVTLVEGDAHQAIAKLSGPLDVVLLDAEKEGFTDYLKKLLPLVRSGGLIIGHDSTGHADQMQDYFKLSPRMATWKPCSSTPRIGACASRARCGKHRSRNN